MNDILNVAEALERSPIAVVRDSCVAVRNRNASCRKCIDACAAGAITVTGNEIELLATLCTACGACATACPTEALRPLQPSDAELAQAAARSLAANGASAVFACARIASKRRADPARYAEVPCLTRIDESIVLAMAAHGAERVVLVDGGCETCKYRDNSPLVDETASFAQALIGVHGPATTIERATGFPEDFLVEKPNGLYGTTRRGFFTEAASAAKETAMTAAKATIAQELGYAAQEAEIGERLRVAENGALPYIQVARHDVVINSMDALGAPVSETVESRRFGTVEIDAPKCNACGMCATFCPTGALRRHPSEKRSDPVRVLEFSACDCVQCGLCVDVCWKGALSFDTSVSSDELFDFEPRSFDLGNAKPKSDMFGCSSQVPPARHSERSA